MLCLNWWEMNSESYGLARHKGEANHALPHYRPGAFAQTFPPSSLRAELTQDNIAGTLASVCRKLGTALKLSRLF